MSLPEPYYNDDPKSFAYPTIHSRWPKIIQGAIDDVKSVINTNENLQSTGTNIVIQLQELLASFKNDEVVRSFTTSEINLSKEDLKSYNSTLIKLNEHKKVTWQTGPWLYLECYLYQYINNLFLAEIKQNSFWSKYDVFQVLKDKTFQQSEFGVLELLKKYHSLVADTKLHEQQLTQDQKLLLFRDFIDISLWGNATDLSLLAGNVTLEDIKSLQGAETRKKNEENILVNDIEDAWKQLINKQDTDRVDIVLDNSGFELYSDVIFALFLLDFKIVKQVKLHCKTIPWFVSDTRPVDVVNFTEQLKSSDFFPEIHSKHKQDIDFLNSKIATYIADDKLTYEDNIYWTLGGNYWNLGQHTKLYEDLKKHSSLIIFKGDLNYRKLTGDLQWDKTTPFITAIQDLATSQLPILSLRTCKADVVVGLKPGVNEELIERYKAQGNEIGEFWSSSGKWAVISFSNGKN
ncbi:Ty3 transposition effector [Scheffersomyces amazonensis]|uniref:Ty3 transposition effector n=1 Tax=Scheffersomyces amazonensis TaxID=1078765 RepID=UPI00315DACBC